MKAVLTFFTIFFCTSLSSVVAQVTLEDMYKAAIKFAQSDYEIQLADSLSHEAIARAEASLDQNEIYKAYMAYLNRDVYIDLTKISDANLEKAIDLADGLSNPRQKFNLWVAVSAHFLAKYNVKRGSELAHRALSYAASTNDDEIKARAYMITANAARVDRRMKDAWQNLLNAQNFLAKKENKNAEELSNLLNIELVDFYTAVNNYKKAKEVKQLQMNSFLSKVPIDSIGYMWSQYELCNLIAAKDSEFRLDGKIDQLLSFANHHNNGALRHYTKALHRRYLISNFRLSEFNKHYGNEFNKKWDQLKSATDTAEYCLSNALFCEHKNKIDSAGMYYGIAIRVLKGAGNPLRLANYHRRYGEFLFRTRQNREAYSQLQEALRLSEKANYPVYILNVLDPLDTLARSFGDYQAAYKFSELKHRTQAQVAHEQIKENLLIMELENQQHQNEIRQKDHKEEEKKRHNLQYFAIAVFLIVLFLVIVVVSSFAVPLWLIDMLGFFSILFIFEFIILILDHKIHHWAHGAPMKMFLVKIAILSVLFPWHHVIEHRVTDYLKKRKQISVPNKSFFKNILASMYPWLSEKSEDKH